MTAQNIKDIVKQEKLVPILRTESPKTVMDVAKAVVDSGCKVLEYTMSIPGIIAEIGKVKNRYPELTIGLGTVYKKEDAKTALENGVDFIVSPILSLELVETVKNADRMVILSGFTPTEIYQAYQAGSDVVKLFPASEVSTNYIKELRGPMPQVELFPTGGLDLISAIQFILGGAVAVGMGGTVFTKELIKTGAFEQITAQLANARHRIQNQEI